MSEAGFVAALVSRDGARGSHCAGGSVWQSDWDAVLGPRAARARSTQQARCVDDALSTFCGNTEPRELPLGDGTRQIAALRARAVLIDMEEGVVSQLARSPVGELFKQGQIITDVSGAGNNWAHGHELYGPQHRERMLESFRRTASDCDSLQAFSVLHSMGGGTGAGVGTYALELLADEYPRTARIVTAVFPSATDDVITSPYSSVLAAHKLVRHADAVLPVDNAALSALVERADGSASVGQVNLQRTRAITENPVEGGGLGGTKEQM